MKTYPNVSRKYVETTCTAGLLEIPSEGLKLARVYPVPFRFLNEDKKFPKYSWLEVEVEHNQKDGRPESYKLLNPSKIKVLEKIESGREGWKKRMKLILNFVEPIEQIITNWKTKTLGIIKPKELLDFYIQEEEKEWTKEQLNLIRQNILFLELQNIKPLEKVPYKFSYKFLGDDGKEHIWGIYDWEIYQAYRKWRWIYKDKVFEKLREKFFYEFKEKKDIYFVIGNHNRWRNSFFIIGIVYPPKNWNN